MILFPIYAALVWYCAVRWRRDIRGVGAVLAGLGGLGVVWAFHGWFNDYMGGTIYLIVLRILLLPYTVLVGGIGIFLVSLPRTVRPNHCPECEYDLAGLDDMAACPECGQLIQEPAMNAGPRQQPSQS